MLLVYACDGNWLLRWSVGSRYIVGWFPFPLWTIPLLVSVCVGIPTPHFSSDLSPVPLSPSIIILSLCSQSNPCGWWVRDLPSLPTGLTCSLNRDYDSPTYLYSGAPLNQTPLRHIKVSLNIISCNQCQN